MNIGVDIVSIDRIQRLYEKYGTDFLDCFLTEQEKQEPITPGYLAKCWAVKEASIKASNVKSLTAFSYVKEGDIPKIQTHQEGTYAVSVSDEDNYAIAMVIKTQ